MYRLNIAARIVEVLAGPAMMAIVVFGGTDSLGWMTAFAATATVYLAATLTELGTREPKEPT